MLMLYYGTVEDKTRVNNFVCGLPKASEVKVTQEINGQYSLSFKYPTSDDTYKSICENMAIDCEGQLYRIMSTQYSESLLTVDCLHVYDADAPTYHIPTIEVMSGVSPKDVITTAFSDTKFNVLSEDAVEDLGMHWVGYDGFLIDFETTDKTSPYSVIEQVTENAGIGELYRDNYNIALVTYLGGTGRTAISKTDRLKLTLNKNLSAITVTRDISSMVNRLYVYGSDDLTIASANPTGLAYIENTESIEKYGVKAGYKDFSDCKSAAALYDSALWEFSNDNDYRIDVPTITIEGKIIDLSRLQKYADFSDSYGAYKRPTIGMPVEVTDMDGTVYNERITKIEYYPYEPKETTVTIGNVKRDAVFYLRQLGKSMGCNWRIIR